MDVIRMILLLSVLISGLHLLAGLISPILVLWWMDVQNRMKVLRLYGLIFLVSGVLYLLL